MLRGFIIVAFMVACTSASAGGDAERGKQLFRKCAACHMLGTKAKQRVGPPLNGILAAPAAGVEGFRYSTALKAAAAEGLMWNADALDAFLSYPRGFIPKTKMSFRGLSKEQDRADVIAYLATFSGDGSAAPVEVGFNVSADILALEGDAEYGEYLGSECITCHQINGGNDGIPSITGWDTDDFVTAMHAYRGKHRKNPVMQMISGRLADDEIAALAAYFKDLNN